MHRSLMSMQGLPVVSEQGVRLGSIQDAYFDAFEHRIIAFLVDWENDLVRGPEELLPITQITSLNADVVTVGGEMAVTAGLEYDWQVETEGLSLAYDDLIGKPVQFKTQGALGELVDLLFDPQDGSVEAYEVSPADGVKEGQPTYMVSPQPEIDFQADKLVLPDDFKDRLETRTRTSEGGRLEVTMIDVEPEEDRVGEEDIEVVRSQSTQPY